MPFVSIPVLLQNATNKDPQNNSQPGSSPFGQSKTSSQAAFGNGNPFPPKSEPLNVGADIPTTVETPFRSLLYKLDSRDPYLGNSYEDLRSISSMYPFVRYSFEELRLKDYIQGQPNANVFGSGFGGFGSTTLNANNSGNNFGGGFPSTTATAKPTASLFPSAATLQPNKSSFGSTNDATSGTSAFGSTPHAQSTPSSFGSTSNAVPTSTPSSFGFAPYAQSTPLSFGSTSNAVPTSTPSFLGSTSNGGPTTTLLGTASMLQSPSAQKQASTLFPHLGSDGQQDAEIYRWIRKEIQANRGTELQGTLNPDVLPLLFHQQAHKWGDVAEKHFFSVEKTTMAVMKGILENTHCDQITKKKIWPRIQDAGSSAEKEKLQSLQNHVHDIVSRHLQTSSSSFEEKVAEARFLRFRAALDRYRISQNAKKAAVSDGTSDISDNFFIVDMRDTAALFSELHMSNSRNLENEIHDTLKAYYEIARDDFIEYVTQHIVENFINNEQGPVLMFSPLYVAGLSDEDIQDLAREDEVVVKERDQKEATLERLKRAERIALRYA